MTVIAYVLLKEDRAIHMLVFESSTQKFSIIHGIYAPAQPRDKDVSWDHLRNLNSIIEKL